MRAARNGVFIAATGQHVGKTTTCLGLVSALKDRFSRLTFMKPVGQVRAGVPHGGVYVVVCCLRARGCACVPAMAAGGVDARVIAAVAASSWSRRRCCRHRRGATSRVSQKHIVVKKEDGSTKLVDKDCAVFRDYFGLQQTWDHISPVLLPSVRRQCASASSLHALLA
jgi:hypothetical protein